MIEGFCDRVLLKVSEAWFRGCDSSWHRGKAEAWATSDDDGGPRDQIRSKIAENLQLLLREEPDKERLRLHLHRLHEETFLREVEIRSLHLHVEKKMFHVREFLTSQMGWLVKEALACAGIVVDELDGEGNPCRPEVHYSRGPSPETSKEPFSLMEAECADVLFEGCPLIDILRAEEDERLEDEQLEEEWKGLLHVGANLEGAPFTVVLADLDESAPEENRFGDSDAVTTDHLMAR